MLTQEEEETNALLRAVAQNLMRVAYDEANRLANHCSDSAARWAMNNLYRAANAAKVDFAIIDAREKAHRICVSK